MAHSFPPARAATRWAAVVAHYDPAGQVARHLLATVQALHTQGAQVCVVSTGLAAQGAAQLAAHAQVITRDNVGYDFGSYKAGIAALGDLQRLERLLLLNSSMLVVQPERLLARMQAQLQAQAAQPDPVALLGLTLSHEVQPHLQSFWLCFEGRAILGSEAFAQWWATLQTLSDREEVIARQELGLSAHFARAGFRLGAMFLPSRAQQLRAVARALENGFLPLDPGDAGPVAIDPAWADRLNPTMYAWDAVFEQLGVLKLELLKRNPHRLNLVALRERLRQDAALAALVMEAAALSSIDALP